MLINFIFLTKGNSGNMKKNLMAQKVFFSTQCFTIHKQDLGKALQLECFGDPLVLQRAARSAEHVLVPALFPPWDWSTHQDATASFSCCDLKGRKLSWESSGGFKVVSLTLLSLVECFFFFFLNSLLQFQSLQDFPISKYCELLFQDFPPSQPAVLFFLVKHMRLCINSDENTAM